MTVCCADSASRGNKILNPEGMHAPAAAGCERPLRGCADAEGRQGKLTSLPTKTASVQFDECLSVQDLCFSCYTKAASGLLHCHISAEVNSFSNVQIYGAGRSGRVQEAQASPQTGAGARWLIQGELMTGPGCP